MEYRSKMELESLGITETQCKERIAEIDVLIARRAGKPYRHSIGGGKSLSWSVNEVAKLRAERELWEHRRRILKGTGDGVWLPQAVY